MIQNLRKLNSNILLLSVSYSINFATPIISIPILIAKFGIDHYGLISLSQAIVLIFVSIADFGSSITGVKIISQNNESSLATQTSCNLIINSRLILVLLGFPFLLALVFVIPQWQSIWPVIMSSYTIVLGLSLFPKWYFEGTQKMLGIAILNIVSRFLYLASITFLLNASSNFIWVNTLSGASWVLTGICGLLYMRYIANIKWSPTKLVDIISFLKGNFSIFISGISHTLFKSSAVIIAGFFLGAAALGTFSYLDKLIAFIRGAFTFIHGGIFPEVCRIVQRKETLNNFYVKVLSPIALIILLGAIVFYVYGNELISMLIQKDIAYEIRDYCKQIALIPLLILLNVPISITLLATDLKNDYFKYNLVVLISFLFFATLLGTLFQISGFILSYIIVELIALCFGYFILIKQKWIAFI